jgi:Fe-S cluster biogenesis protein NfuA
VANANDGDVQEQIRRLGQLVAQFDQLPDGPAKSAGKELVQLLMDVHGAGLERILEIVFESGETAPRVIEQLGQDPLAGSLLLLYSLHPDGLETRVGKAVERMGPRLRKLACTIESVRIEDGAVQVRIAKAGHNCGSSAGDLRAIVEDGVYEMAPDVASLEVLGLEEPAAAGFVSIESLMAQSLAAGVANGHERESEAAD